MPIILGDLFSGPEAKALAAAAGALTFEDGRATAGRTARTVKDNEQAVANAETEAVLEMVRRKLLSHPLFQAVALPKSFVRLSSLTRFRMLSNRAWLLWILRRNRSSVAS